MESRNKSTLNAVSSMPQTLIRINAQLQWRFTIGSGGNYVAVCDPLKLTLQAETWGDLMQDTAEVLNLIFMDLLRDNQLDAFLQAHGWSLTGPATQNQQNVRFDVPFFFVPEMASNGAQTYACK